MFLGFFSDVASRYASLNIWKALEWDDLPILNISLFLLQGAGQDRLGIYIKSVVKGGAADAVSTYTW